MPKEPIYVFAQEELAINGTDYDPEQTGTQIMAIGSTRRTTIFRDSHISGGPKWPDGVRKSLFTAVSEVGEVEVYEVESAGELANLPTNAIDFQIYLNLLNQENPGLANQISGLLGEISYHTAHHTAGSDKRERLKSMLRLSQLNSLIYQDKKIGSGIVIYEQQGQRVDEASVKKDDGVGWYA